MEEKMEVDINLDNDTRKMRIINYLAYMDDKSLREISVALYDLSKRRQELNNRKGIENAQSSE
tara:strand:- start:49 stop:237 length:189 start_codon:yes stop_codon:yes gene_type:complete